MKAGCFIGLIAFVLALTAPAQAATSSSSTNGDPLIFFARTFPIRSAVKAGDVTRVASLLVEHPDWIESPDLEGNTLLHTVAGQGGCAIAELLLVNGAAVNATNKSLHTPLHQAAIAGHANVAALLLTNRADFLLRCSQSKTPLMEACENGRLAVAEILLLHGAPIGQTTPAGETPLHLAAAHGHMEIASLLVARGADVNVTDSTRHTPLHRAALNGSAEMAALLLTNGASFTLRCQSGRTPLQEACEHGHNAVAEILLTHGASVDAPLQNGNSPLHLAAQKGYSEVAAVLLAHGAGVTATNQSGESPLHLAASQGHTALVELLLANGADAAARNAAFKLPLELASESHHENIARILRLHLAQVAARRPDTRMRVLVLPFHNDTGKAEHAHWSSSFAGLLDTPLGTLESLQVLPSSAVHFSFRQLGVKAGDALTTAQATHVGQLVEARRVIWGGYRRIGSQWRVSARVLNVASGKTSREFSATSTNWYDVRDRVVEQVVRELQTTPSADQWTKMRRRMTRSLEAMDWFSKAIAAKENAHPNVAEVESCLRRSLAADPEFAGARRGLAAVLGTQGKFAEAKQLVEALIADEPGNATARQLLGAFHLLQHNFKEAEESLRLALRADPDDPETGVRLGEYYTLGEHWEAALHYWTEAARINPFSPGIHTHLADAYVNIADRANALRELAEAARLDPDDLDAAQFAPQVYERLGEWPQAVAGYEKFIRLAREAGLNPKAIELFTTGCEKLKPRLKTTTVNATVPKEYTAEELQGALRSRLTGAELRLAVNPLADTPEMRRWALELTRDDAGDEARARAIFGALVSRIQSRGEHNARTAREVFAAWQDPKASFICNEFAKLYIALARAAGLRAFYVHLERDYENQIVYHDCAIVFLSGKAVLVDPAYRWFGVPHREFTVLDDLEVIGHQLCQSSDGREAVTRARAGVKLQPKLPWAHLALASACLNAGRLADAEQALAEAGRLETNRWDGFKLAGAIAVRRGDSEMAQRQLTRGLELNPDDGASHTLLARLLAEQGKLAEARDQYRLALRCFLAPSEEREISQELAMVNARLGGESTPALKAEARNSKTSGDPENRP